MTKRTTLLLIATLLAGACHRESAGTATSSSSSGGSASGAESLLGNYLIANPESETVKKGYDARIANAKSEAEAATLRAEAQKSSEVMQTRATIRPGRLVLRRGGQVVFEAMYRVESASTEAVELRLEGDAGAGCHVEIVAPDMLRVPSLEKVAGGADWKRQGAP